MRPEWLPEEMYEDIKDIEDTIYRDSLGLILGTSPTPDYDHMIARSMGL